MNIEYCFKIYHGECKRSQSLIINIKEINIRFTFLERIVEDTM